MSIMGILLVISNPTRGRAQKSNAVVHPAPASQVISVTVTDLGRAEHGHDVEILIAQAVGFPNDICDVVTTFDVVRKYEERQTWRNVRQRVAIVVNGTPYPAKFREVGIYPLGFNLACIDFDSPFRRTELKLAILPFDRDSPDPSSLSYDDKEIAKGTPGTPFLNERGEISSVLVTSSSGQLEFASAHDIRTFLKVAADVAPD
jgi:hypothetical protein